jgi:hypothetical protein
LAAFFIFPTLVIFCENSEGLATARALAAATSDVGGLNLKLRQDVRMYYKVRTLFFIFLFSRLCFAFID